MGSTFLISNFWKFFKFLEFVKTMRKKISNKIQKAKNDFLFWNHGIFPKSNRKRRSIFRIRTGIDFLTLFHF